MTQLIVYWYGIIGVPGKGPNWTEPYDPNKTIGQVIQNMTTGGCGERNKRIEILKFQPGNMSKFDQANPHWSHDTKMSDYVSYYGGLSGKYVQLIYVIL